MILANRTKLNGGSIVMVMMVCTVSSNIIMRGGYMSPELAIDIFNAHDVGLRGGLTIE